MTISPASWVGLDLEQGRYHVSAALGEGGMAYIYRAVDRKKLRDVVLKVPKPALLADAEFVHRFAREVKTLVELRHPAIVSVLGFGRHLGQPFVVLEYMAGGTLDDRPKPCRPEELDEWLADIAAALDHLHAHGYVHRDVKPSNILFDEAGKARLSDFGVIKAIDEKAGQTKALTESGVAIGTPEYMAPELARGEAYDGRVDQYALAVTVYEMLAGRRPIEGGTGPVVLVKQIQDVPIALHELDSTIPVPLAAAVGRALAKQPSQRYETCSEFAAVVSSAVGDRPLPGQTPALCANPTANNSSANSLWWLPPLLAAILVTGGLAAWLATRPITTAEQAKVEEESPPAARDLFALTAVVEPAFVGKPSFLVVRVDRKDNWSGPIEVKLENPPTASEFRTTTAMILPDQSECRLEFRPRQPLQDVQVTINATASSAQQQTATVLLNARPPSFTVSAIDGVDLAPGDSRYVSIFLNREGFDEPVDLVLRGPRGLRIEPSEVRVAANKNETSVKLTAVSPAVGLVRLMHNGLEKGNFEVRIVATTVTSTTPPPPEKSDAKNARSPLRETSAINVLAFHPLSESTLAVWNARGGVSLWDMNSRMKKASQQLSTPALHGTFSPDGRQVISCGLNLVHLMNHRGETLSQGPSNYRILGVYYDGQMPLFWTPNGVCNAVGRLVQAGSPGRGVTKLKYATSGNGFSLRDLGGKVQFRQGSMVQDWPVDGRIIDFALSHDGRWAAIAAGSKVWIQDTQRHEASPVWSQNIDDVNAVAIAPDGRRLAVGLNNGEIRLFSIEPSQ
jgi:serine/threonine protein kinase